MNNEKESIEAAVNSIERPEFVLGFEVTLMNDWSGDRAASIRLKLSDQFLGKEAPWAALRSYEQLIFTAIQNTGTDRWPYTSVITESEMQDRVAA
jgi:hypothetical protein